MAVTSEMVKQLREETGAGVMDVKKALDQNGGDMAKAAAWLKEKGLAAAAKKASREANEGKIETYTHMGGRMAVMVEVNCETDFVARMPEFQTLAHDLAIQIASASPTYVKREDVPSEIVASMMQTLKDKYLAQGKPDNIADRAAASEMENFYAETCLLDQSFVKDDGVKIKDLVTRTVAKCGENIVIRRFTRYQLGGE